MSLGLFFFLKTWCNNWKHEIQYEKEDGWVQKLIIKKKANGKESKVDRGGKEKRGIDFILNFPLAYPRPILHTQVGILEQIGFPDWLSSGEFLFNSASLLPLVQCFRIKFPLRYTTALSGYILQFHFTLLENINNTYLFYDSFSPISDSIIFSFFSNVFRFVRFVRELI